MLKILCAAFALSGLAASSAQAHVVLADPQAIPGVTYAALFRISHGCENSPTVAVRVEIPVGATALSGEPEQGWTLHVERKGGRIFAVTWSGGFLAPKARGNFGILLRLPQKPTTLYFPTVQKCRLGENRWTEIPAPEQAWHDVPHPAPVLTVAPASTKPDLAAESSAAGPAEEHHHH